MVGNIHDPYLTAMNKLISTTPIGVGTGGPGGARPPQFINQGGPGPPNVGAIKGIFTVKMDFLINNFLGSSTNFNLKFLHT